MVTADGCIDKHEGADWIDHDGIGHGSVMRVLDWIDHDSEDMDGNIESIVIVSMRQSW